jgi:hypothetical membrane protein
MIFQSLSKLCVSRTQCCSNSHRLQKVAKACDWITALALLIIGILSASMIAFHMPPALTFFLLGSGTVYTLALISLEASNRCRKI